MRSYVNAVEGRVRAELYRSVVFGFISAVQFGNESIDTEIGNLDDSDFSRQCSRFDRDVLLEF